MPQTRQDKVNALFRDAMAAMEPLLERLELMPEPVPERYWPPPPLPTSPSAIRRTLVRMRAGKTRPADPNIPPEVALPLLERLVEHEDLYSRSMEESEKVFDVLDTLVARGEWAEAREAISAYRESRPRIDLFGYTNQFLLALDRNIREEAGSRIRRQLDYRRQRFAEWKA
jgi:hypothetical protein